jgi:hypothetical protein
VIIEGINKRRSDFLASTPRKPSAPSPDSLPDQPCSAAFHPLGESRFVVILSGFLGVPMVYWNRLFFNMFPASFLEKALVKPFVFNMFQASGICGLGRQKVTLQSLAGKARKMFHHQYLVRPREGRRIEPGVPRASGTDSCLVSLAYLPAVVKRNC